MSNIASRDALTPVAELVHGPAVVVETKTVLKTVAETLGDLGIGMVVVMNKGSVAGVVTERDLVWAVARGAELDEVWAADVMSEDVIAVEPTMTVAEAAEVMSAQNARHLLVIQGDSPGVVSMRDVIEYLI